MDSKALWPAKVAPLSATAQTELLQRLKSAFAELLNQNQLPRQLNAELSRLYLPLAAWLNRQRTTTAPLLVGINGSQGSGKSTLCSLLKWILETAFNCRTCIISIDDLYLTQAARRQLAAQVHPLLATRGVPGTHDIALGLEIFRKLKEPAANTSIEIPRFNKATDDRLPRTEWDQLNEPSDMILFEGWCVGAPPQTEAELAAPLNLLEAKEDKEGCWRSYVNRQLDGPYRQLFAQLELLLLLKIPAWEMVYHWRKRQEEQLAAKQSGAGVMDDAALVRFIQHYERLTRHQLTALPDKADLVMELDREQRVIALHQREPAKA
jgi:D-glycerate 3-kinase